MPVDGSELAGSLLVAMPQLQDPNFRRAVVLLVEHDESGTFGLVLNRPTDVSVATLCSSLDVDWAGEPNLEIQWGGPVQPNTGWVVFNENLALSGDEEGVAELERGRFCAGSLDGLKAIARTPPSDVLVCVGYAGGGPGQLESEMATGAWLVAPLSAETVFDVEHDEMWMHVVRGLGVDPATLVSTSGIH